MREEILVHFANLIKKELGIVYDEMNFFQLKSRLTRVARALDYETVEDFYKKSLERLSSKEASVLFDTATNNETSFFRDIKPFETLVEISKDIFSKKNTLDIWSAACSSGQEAISIVITLLNNFPGKNIKIHGTDISSAILKKASSFKYTEHEISRGLSAEQKITYFNKLSKNEYQLKEQYSSLIEFSEVNLTQNYHFPQKFDIVFCRNILIYHDIEGKKYIVSRLTQFIAPRGYLFLGSGENIFGLSDKFEQHKICDSIVFQMK